MRRRDEGDAAAAGQCKPRDYVARALEMIGNTARSIPIMLANPTPARPDDDRGEAQDFNAARPLPCAAIQTSLHARALTSLSSRRPARACRPNRSSFVEVGATSIRPTASHRMPTATTSPMMRDVDGAVVRSSPAPAPHSLRGSLAGRPASPSSASSASTGIVFLRAFRSRGQSRET